MSDVFESIKRGLSEAIEYERGSLPNVKIDYVTTKTSHHRYRVGKKSGSKAFNVAGDYRTEVVGSQFTAKGGLPGKAAYKNVHKTRGDR
jgi:hypothetical protein